MKPKLPRVFDTFCYFNEDLILKLRLDTLWDVVDYFVLVEARYTQTGQPKELNFDPKKFSKYLSKIRYVVAENPPGGTVDFWANENAQRNEIFRGLYGAQDSDLILVSDVDEIPDPQKIRNYDPRYKRGDFLQVYLSYYFNNLLYSPHREKIWLGSKITSYGHFRTFFGEKANSVRSWKSTGPLRWFKRRFFRSFQVQKIPSGGWHFTWILSSSDIQKKMSVMAHQENNKPNLRDPKYIASQIKGGRDIVRRDRRYRVVKIDERFPAPLRRYPEEFSLFILDY
jgi:beta-1,4-mannosyl-glycoprotein beta-1,4-N-acetylglucosaminyltransferase